MDSFVHMLDAKPERPFHFSAHGSSSPSLAVLWRTNLPSTKRHLSYPAALTAAKKSGYSLFDVGSMVSAIGDIKENEKPWHIKDGIHPNPWVTEETNNFLLNYLCSKELHLYQGSE